MRKILFAVIALSVLLAVSAARAQVVGRQRCERVSPADGPGEGGEIVGEVAQVPQPELVAVDLEPLDRRHPARARHDEGRRLRRKVATEGGRPLEQAGDEALQAR